MSSRSADGLGRPLDAVGNLARGVGTVVAHPLHLYRRTCRTRTFACGLRDHLLRDAIGFAFVRIVGRTDAQSRLQRPASTAGRALRAGQGVIAAGAFALQHAVGRGLGGWRRAVGEGHAHGAVGGSP
jgi:hypothetical protein